MNRYSYQVFDSMRHPRQPIVFQLFAIENLLTLMTQRVRILTLLCLVGALLSVPVSHAANIPGFDRAVVINAREQTVEQFLTELFGQLNVPVRVKDSISGSVNGDFRKSAREVFHDISSSFQLSIYYDGAVAHIYPSNDVEHDILYMPRNSARNIERAARKLGFVDPHNNLSATDVGLVVTGAPQFVEQIERMSLAMQRNVSEPQPASEDTYRTFQLRYAWADDVSLQIGGETVLVPGVASLIRSLIEPGALNRSQQGSLRIPDSPTLEGLRGQGLNTVASQPVGQTASEMQELDLPQVQINGDDGSTVNTRIVADALSNSVIIRDKAERMKVYEELIVSLDREPQMIEIEATIIDLDTDKLRELGINWRLQRDDGEALFGQGTIADELLRPNTDITPSGEGGFMSLILGSQSDFIARIRALETQGAARVVSKPHVMTLSNVEALLDTTSTFFVRVEGQEEVDLFDVSVGTTLRVTPHVYERSGRSQIKLRVNIQDGSASDQLVDRIPVVENSTITTQAIIDVGQSLLIGGLVRETTANGTTRVPVLGRIPVLGALFRSQTKTSTRLERMFLITPRVTNPKLAGKRFSAPILSGLEADIIQSSSARMDNTRQALSLLEETRPVEQRLPLGDTLRIDEPVLVEPFSPIPSTIDVELDQNRGIRFKQPRPLRERLASPIELPADNQQGQQAAANSLQPESLTSVVAPSHSLTKTDDGWQDIIIDSYTSSLRDKPATGEATNVANNAASSTIGTPSTVENVNPNQRLNSVDADEWQVIN